MLINYVRKKLSNIFPPIELCGDNAAMIAFVGSLMKPSIENDRSSSARARWPLDELKA